MLDKKIPAESKAEDLRFDIRVIPHALRRGTLTPSDVAEALAALPDDAEEGQPSNVVFSTPFANRALTEEG